MAQYISKAALVAEIYQLKKSHDNWSCMGKCFHQEYENLLSFINTLEVKEVEEEPVSEWMEAEINYWIQRGLSIRLEDKYLEDLGFEEGDKVKVIIVKT